MEKFFAAPSAVITGDVILGEGVNVWHNAVIRGDGGPIRIGAGTNIQDNCVVHEQVTVGKNCTVGHSAILHGCTIADDCLVGMGAILLDGAVLERHCMVGAGAVVTGKTHAPEGSLLLGNPAKIIRQLTPEQIEYIHADAKHYLELADKYLK